MIARIHLLRWLGAVIAVLIWSAASFAATQLPIVGSDALAAEFGTGGDGPLSCSSGTTTLTRNMQYSSVTITGTCVVKLNSYEMWVSGVLDISQAGAGAIVNNGIVGVAASGATGGSTAAPNPGSVPTLRESTATGGTGNTTTGTAGSLTISAFAAGTQLGAAGAGGRGGNGSSSGATGVAAVTISTAYPLSTLSPQWFGLFTAGTQSATVMTPILVAGGGGQGGGDGSNAGGGGGGPSYGGEPIVIRARFIQRGTNATAGIVQSKGGNGGQGGNSAGGNAGGGAGGGAAPGGTVYIVTEALLGSAIANAIDVSGGNGGPGGNGTGAGIGGTGGTGGGTGCVYEHVTGAGTYTATAPQTAGSAATVASTTAGTTGGAGATLQVSL